MSRSLFCLVYAKDPSSPCWTTGPVEQACFRSRLGLAWHLLWNRRARAAVTANRSLFIPLPQPKTPSQTAVQL